VNLGDWAAWATIAALVVGAIAALLAWLTLRQPHKDRTAETRQQLADILNEIEEASARYCWSDVVDDDGTISQRAPFPRRQFRAKDAAKELQVAVDKLKSVQKKNLLPPNDARRIERIQNEAQGLARSLKEDAQKPTPHDWTDEPSQRALDVAQLRQHAEAELRAFLDRN